MHQQTFAEVTFEPYRNPTRPYWSRQPDEADSFISATAANVHDNGVNRRMAILGRSRSVSSSYTTDGDLMKPLSILFQMR